MILKSPLPATLLTTHALPCVPLQQQTILADVNADEEQQLAAEYEVKGYPTFVHFPPKSTSQNPVHYNGGQSVRPTTPFAPPGWVTAAYDSGPRQLAATYQ